MSRPLILILLFVFIDVLGFGLILPLLPYYAADFNASAVMVGLLLSANALTQMIGAPILGRLSDRCQRVQRGFGDFILESFIPGMIATVGTIAGSSYDDLPDIGEARLQTGTTAKLAAQRFFYDEAADALTYDQRKALKDPALSRQAPANFPLSSRWPPSRRPSTSSSFGRC